MKKLYFLFLLSFLIVELQAQSFSWAKDEGLWAYDYGYGIVNDNSGNVYVAGKYEDAAIFSGAALTNAGNHDMFLVKYSSTGTLECTRTSGGSLGDYAHALAIDASNNLLVTGEIEGYGNQVSFQGSSITFNSVGDNDIFLAKYADNGTLLWAKSEGYNYSEKGLGITSDASGNVYICGYFTDTTIIGGAKYSGKGYRDAFVAKYDMNGVFQWVRNGGSTGRDEAKAVKCDANGNVYVCGMYSNGAVFGSQTLASPNGYYDSYLAKYASDGTLNWIKTSGGDYDDVAWGVTLDNAGKVYITGEYNAYAGFDGIYLTTSGNADAFVACYDASGSIQWATSAGGIASSGNMITRARGIGCDGTNLYITGQFGGSATFGSYNLTAADSSDIFMAKLNNAGVFTWAMSAGGAADATETLGYESGNSICAEAGGNVYVTGSLLDGGIFGSTSVSAYSRTDVFVSKITQGTSAIAKNNFDNQHEPIIFPNPTTGNLIIDLSQMTDQKLEITFFNCLGQPIEKRTVQPTSKINIDLSAQEKGIYFLQIRHEDQTKEMKRIILR